MPEELVHLLGPKVGGFLGGDRRSSVCAAALLIQVRKKWGYRGLHDFASGCHVTQKPFPVRKLRLSIAQPTPLDTVLAADGRPAPGRRRVRRSRAALGRSHRRAGVGRGGPRARPQGAALAPPVGQRGTRRRPGAPDAPAPARLRIVGWAGAAYDWTAYAAPLGGPLAEAVRPGRPLPWADARYLLEQLVEEFRAAEADGSLPPRLALDHIWVEPNGRVQVLDFPLCAARYRPNAPLSGAARGRVADDRRAARGPAAARSPRRSRRTRGRCSTTCSRPRCRSPSSRRNWPRRTPTGRR